MYVLTITYIIAAFIIGAVIVYIFQRKRGKQENSSTVNAQKEELVKLRQQLTACQQTSQADKAKYEKLLDEAREQASKINGQQKDLAQLREKDKAKYEKLLAEAHEQLKHLEQQIASCMKGYVDEAVMAKLAEAEKLTKKIKDLEDDLEEAEDDLEDAKKKLRNKESDFADLQDQFDKQNKEVNTLKEDLNVTRKDLEEKAEYLKQKTSSLRFVKAILKADVAKTADIRELYKKVDIVEQFVKGKWSDINSFLYSSGYLAWNEKEGLEGFNLQKKYFYDSFDQWAATKRKSWLDGKTAVAFVGEFSAGKTSIVNRVLSQDDPSVPQLPVKTEATTAIPTYIAGGVSNNYWFVSPDDKLKTISEERFKNVSKNVLDQIEGVSSLIKYFVMTYKNPKLNGLSLLDTPGFNSNDKDDAERTLEVINECDALFWVFDVNTGTINRSSIDTIKKGLNKPLYVVINKIDTKPKSEIDRVERLIRKTLNEAGIPVVKYIRFSTKAFLADIMNPIKEVAHIKERDTFLDDVDSNINRVLDIMQDLVNAEHEAYNNACNSASEMDEGLRSVLKDIQENCETAKSIPNFEEHWYKKDNYEMSQYEYGQLKFTLESASSQAEYANDGFKNRIDLAENVQQAWTNYCNAQNAWQRVNELNKQFQKIRKNFN